MAVKEKSTPASSTIIAGKIMPALALRKIASNTAQSRGMGVLPYLKERGYGAFEKMTPEKESIWSMLLDDSPEKRAEGAALVEESEPTIVTKAESIQDSGQLQAIGVRLDGNEYDIIFGAQRAFAVAFNYAKGRGPDTIEAKVIEGDFTPFGLKLLSLKENDDRQGESPIDRALTYQFLMKESKITQKKLAEQIGYSVSHVQNHIELLDKLLVPDRMKIHKGTWSVDKALKTLKLRRMTGDEKAELEKEKSEKKQQRLPGTKGLSKIYEGSFPKDMAEEEKQLWLEPAVRRLISYKLSVEYTEAPPERKPEPAKEETNGTTPVTEKKLTIKIGRETANRLFVVLGKTAAKTWSEETMTDKLNNIADYMDSPDQKVESAPLQAVLNKVVQANAKGVTVVLKEG